MSKQRFQATLVAGSQGGVGIIIPFDVQKIYGTRARVRVKGTVDGVPYKAAITPMGKGTHDMIIRKELRKQLGKEAGDRVTVEIGIDTEKRTVVVPPDFQAALAKNKKAKDIFEKLAYTHRREYTEWITTAKREETRTRRIAQAVERIARGEKFS